MRNFPSRSRHRTQSGIALVVVMLVMVILTMLGIMLLLQGDTNQLLTRNERDTATCRQAAEAALRQGVRLAGALYSPTNHFTTQLAGCAGADCPTQNSDLAPTRIVDRPGTAFDAGWIQRLYLSSPSGSSGNVYVTVFMRNNPDDPQPATAADQYKTDTDSVVTIIGEAEMTFDGATPLADRSNVRIRKMMAAEIRVVTGRRSGIGRNDDSWHTGTSY